MRLLCSGRLVFMVFFGLVFALGLSLASVLSRVGSMGSILAGSFYLATTCPSWDYGLGYFCAQKVLVSPGGWCWYAGSFLRADLLISLFQLPTERYGTHMMQFQQLRLLEHCLSFTTQILLIAGSLVSFALPLFFFSSTCASYLFGQRTLAA